MHDNLLQFFTHIIYAKGAVAEALAIRHSGKFFFPVSV
jgi:hypothetical protein